MSSCYSKRFPSHFGDGVSKVSNIFLFLFFADADVSFKIGFLDRVFIASFLVNIPFDGRKIFSIQLLKKAFF